MEGRRVPTMLDHYKTVHKFINKSMNNFFPPRLNEEECSALIACAQLAYDEAERRGQTALNSEHDPEKSCDKCRYGPYANCKDRHPNLKGCVQFPTARKLYFTPKGGRS